MISIPTAGLIRIDPDPEDSILVLMP